MKFRLSVVLLILVTVFIADQYTKFWAVNALMFQEPRVFLNGMFQLVYAENPGAFLGFGGGWSKGFRFIVFALVVFFGLGAMFWYLIKKEDTKFNLLTYSFILSGGVGNLWDRVFHEDGHVIDFMLIDLGGPFRTGVFNIADVFIVLGVTMAFYNMYLESRKAKLIAKSN